MNHDSANREVFPCRWIEKVFYAERLIGRPENIEVLVMGEDPASRACNSDHLVMLQALVTVFSKG